MRIVILSGLLLIAVIQSAQGASFCISSNIIMGVAASCQSATPTVKSFPVRQKDGIYQDCDIFMGDVGICSDRSNIKQFPVKQSNGQYLNCDISMGIVGYCQGATDTRDFPIER